MHRKPTITCSTPFPGRFMIASCGLAYLHVHDTLILTYPTAS